jgi:hypothetical protein
MMANAKTSRPLAHPPEETEVTEATVSNGATEHRAFVACSFVIFVVFVIFAVAFS